MRVYRTDHNVFDPSKTPIREKKELFVFAINVITNQHYKFTSYREKLIPHSKVLVNLLLNIQIEFATFFKLMHNYIEINVEQNLKICLNDFIERFRNIAIDIASPEVLF